jgi:transcriptional regulator with XRE-family HTH domain
VFLSPALFLQQDGAQIGVARGARPDGHEGLEMMKKKKFLLFGKRVRIARQRTGLTQAELGKQLGLVKYGAVRISRFECGRHMPDINFVEKMAAVLKVPSFYFYCADNALARMFLRLADCLGDDWERFLLAQMQEVLAQPQATALPEKRNANRRHNTDGSWPDAERRTCVDQRACADRRSQEEKRRQVDRRSGQQGAEKSQDRRGGDAKE